MPRNAKLFAAIIAASCLTSAAHAAPDQSVQFLDKIVNEADGVVLVPWQRLGPNRGNAFSFSYTTLNGQAIAGQDYVVTAGTRQVSASETAGAISIPITDDSEAEGDEGLGLKATAGAGMRCYDCTAAITIPANDATPPPPGTAIQIATITVPENIGLAAVTLTRTGDLSGYTTINVYPRNGTATTPADFGMVDLNFTYAPGETIKTANVPIVDDALDEPEEFLEIVAYGGANGLGRVNISASDGSQEPPPALIGTLGEGDSLSVFWGGNHTGMYASAHSSIPYQGKAVGGSGLNNLIARIQAVKDAKPAIFTVLIGANDLDSYATGQDYLNAVLNYTDQIKAMGTKIAIGAILPQCNRASFNAKRIQYNSALRGYVGGRIDAVIKFDESPAFDQDSDACNLTTFNSDGVHPTNPTEVGGGADGQSQMFAVYDRDVEALRLGSAAEAPVGPDGVQLVSIPSNFPIAPYLAPAAKPGSAAPDVVGAFRFLCAAGQVQWDDPIMDPGGPGPHPHQYFGNLSANRRSTYKSLRESGDSTCNNPLNRSGYWMPAMLNGRGMAVRPDFISIYYKRRPASDPICQGFDKPKGQGICKPLPNGLRYIFGRDMLDIGAPPLGTWHFNCDGPGATQGHYKTIAEAIPFCPIGSRLGIIIQAPDCWDGKRLDSPNHRAHMANGSYGDWGYYRCPNSHPYVLPAFQMGPWYEVDEDFKAGRWTLSCDMMVPNGKPGDCMHADWFGAWDPIVLERWTANCINRLLNCSSGELGDATLMAQLQGYGGKAVPRLVPIPARQ